MPEVPRLTEELRLLQASVLHRLQRYEEALQVLDLVAETERANQIKTEVLGAIKDHSEQEKALYKKMLQ